MTDPTFYTVPEACDLLGISRAYLYRQDIPCELVDGRRVYTLAALRDYANERAGEPTRQRYERARWESVADQLNNM